MNQFYVTLQTCCPARGRDGEMRVGSAAGLDDELVPPYNTLFASDCGGKCNLAYHVVPALDVIRRTGLAI